MHVTTLDENMKKTGKWEGKFWKLFPVLDDLNNNHPMLSGIDPYGDTYFNHLQRLLFLKELEEIFSEELKEEEKESLNSFISFVKDVDEFELLRIVGD